MNHAAHCQRAGWFAHSALHGADGNFQSAKNNCSGKNDPFLPEQLLFVGYQLKFVAYKLKLIAYKPEFCGRQTLRSRAETRRVWAVSEMDWVDAGGITGRLTPFWDDK
jgi:hypothetical protein